MEEQCNAISTSVIQNVKPTKCLEGKKADSSDGLILDYCITIKMPLSCAVLSGSSSLYKNLKQI